MPRRSNFERELEFHWAEIVRLCRKHGYNDKITLLLRNTDEVEPSVILTNDSPDQAALCISAICEETSQESPDTIKVPLKLFTEE